MSIAVVPFLHSLCSLVLCGLRSFQLGFLDFSKLVLIRQLCTGCHHRSDFSDSLCAAKEFHHATDSRTELSLHILVPRIVDEFANFIGSLGVGLLIESHKEILAEFCL